MVTELQSLEWVGHRFDVPSTDTDLFSWYVHVMATLYTWERSMGARQADSSALGSPNQRGSIGNSIS